MKYVLLGSLILALGACSNNDSDNASNMQESDTLMYSVKLYNLTNAQPFSPPAAVLADATFQAWKTGEAASDALEMLAEGGDSAALIATQGTQSSYQASAPVPPGGSYSFEITASDDTNANLTLATMLVNTNDAFTGLSAIDLTDMQNGDKRVYLTQAYDAGTEMNLELAGTIPGPADGGEGFNATRDDVTGFVTNHAGIVGSDDGYTDSVLSAAHRFDNPVMWVEITRI